MTKATDGSMFKVSTSPPVTCTDSNTLNDSSTSSISSFVISTEKQVRRTSSTRVPTTSLVKAVKSSSPTREKKSENFLGVVDLAMLYIISDTDRQSVLAIHCRANK